MPSPMPSMLTTLIEKIDTSPNCVAPTSTASVVSTPPIATSSGMPAATKPPSRITITAIAIGKAIASPRRRSLSDAVAKVSLTSTLPPTRISGASSSWARLSISSATARSVSSSSPPARVTTMRAARPSLERSASRPLDHGSATSITPSSAPIAARPPARSAWIVGSSTSMPSAMTATCPPVSARSSSSWATRPDSVEVPAPNSEESTEKADEPIAAVAIRSRIHETMTARRRRTMKWANRLMMRPPRSRTVSPAGAAEHPLAGRRRGFPRPR